MSSQQQQLPDAPAGLRYDEPLARYTSWRIGGPARYFFEATTPEQLSVALAWARRHDLPICILGAGTNTLFCDEPYPGLVVRYRDQTIQHEPAGEQVRVRIAAGAAMANTARRLARQGLAGLEWAEGLPGTVGGAIIGNAGCYGGDVAMVLSRAWLLRDGAIIEWQATDFGYGYRTSVLKHAGAEQTTMVLTAEFMLTHADQELLAERMARTSAQRRQSTPAGQSCGSVFKNPPGESAGRLIEAAGLKGTRRGAAEIADKHANYIINRGGAQSTDVLSLIALARERVAHQFGIELELEIRIVEGCARSH